MNHLDIRIPEDRGWLYDIVKYPAGEIQTRLTDRGLLAVVKADSYRIVANPIPDVVELAQLNDAVLAIIAFAERTLFLPYMPYSRADRRFMKGDTFALNVFVKMLSTMGFTKVQTFDIHSQMTAALFEQWHVAFENIEPLEDIKTVIDHIGDDGLCIVLPDKGSIKRYFPNAFGPGMRLPRLHNVPVVLGDKVREPITGKLSGFTIDPFVTAFSKALIIDDICDGGGTFIGLGQKILDIAPATTLYLYTSHGIYSQGEERLKTIFRELFNGGFGFNNGAKKDVL